MDIQNIELFASQYPKASDRVENTIKGNSGMIRTPVKDIMYIDRIHDGRYGNGFAADLQPKQSMSPEARQGTKKFLAIFLITLVGAIIYSAFAYTISDSLFGKFGVEFFDDKGGPGAAIIAIHSLIFLCVIYLILNTIKW